MSDSLFTLHDVCSEFCQSVARHRTPALRLQKALRPVLESKDYMEVDEVCEALIAAELIAAARGWPDATLSPKTQAKLQNAMHSQAEPLVELAMQCLEKLKKGDHEVADDATSWLGIPNLKLSFFTGWPTQDGVQQNGRFFELLVVRR